MHSYIKIRVGGSQGMNYLEGCYLETISYAIVWLKDKLLGLNKLNNMRDWCTVYCRNSHEL